MIGSVCVQSRLRRVKTVTIAIPSLHRPDLTARCIEFIQRQTLPSSQWEVIVIENEARPGYILPDPLPANTTRIELPDNEGTTGSINRAVARSSSLYILLLNNDVELEPAYLEKLVCALNADAKLGFAAGKLLRSTQRSDIDGAGDALLMGGGAFRLGHHDRADGRFERTLPILGGCGAAVLYRRDVFERCGSLDEDFFAYLDDMDLGMRAHWLGYRGIYLPDAIAYHLGSATLGDVLHPRIIEYITRNQIFLLMKDYPRAHVWRLLPRIAIFQLLWFAFALRNHGFTPYWRGWRAA